MNGRHDDGSATLTNTRSRRQAGGVTEAVAGEIEDFEQFEEVVIGRELKMLDLEKQLPSRACAQTKAGGSDAVSQRHT